jgi:CheY-like chemotaxis protein
MIYMNAAAPAKKVMVVDDNEIILKTISLRLRAAGYAPLVARDGVEALAVARREPLDLILLDINFPPDVDGEPWDGFRILEWLRHLEHVRLVPVIIISGSESAEDHERAERNGATAFFRKPIDHADLLKVVRETLETAPVPAL